MLAPLQIGSHLASFVDGPSTRSTPGRGARIRNASLFAGSDDHAEAADHMLSLIGSACLHELDRERYLRELMRVLPHWRQGRFLELAPKHWLATRARFDSRQLHDEIGPLRVPDPEQ